MVCFAVLIVCLEAGYRHATIAPASEDQERAIGPIDAAVLALLGLLLALTISSASDRLVHKRELSVAEANAIRTAYLRLDLLPMDTRSSLRDLFGSYIDERIQYTEILDAGGSNASAMGRSVQIQNAIWKSIMDATAPENAQASRALILAPVNQMIDLAGSRQVSSDVRTPEMLLAVIMVLSGFSAFLGGRLVARAGKRTWLNWCVFSLTVSAVLMTLMDIDNPRIGFIRIDAADQIWSAVRLQIQQR